MGEDCICPMILEFYSEPVGVVFWLYWPNKVLCVKYGCHQSAFSPLHVISVLASHRPTDHLEDAVSNLSKSPQSFNNLVYWHIYSHIPIVTLHVTQVLIHLMMRTRFPLLLLFSLPCHVWVLALYQSRWTRANDHSIIKLVPSHSIVVNCHECCLAWHLCMLQYSHFCMW